MLRIPASGSRWSRGCRGSSSNAEDRAAESVLPPLIYSAKRGMSWREFRLHLRPITLSHSSA